MKNKQDIKKDVELVKKEGFWQRWFAPMKNKGPRKDNKFFGFMQQLGGTFMLPVAVLSIAGVCLGLGSGLQGIVTEETSKWGYEILGFILTIGNFFFNLLPLAFTIAIPVGLSQKHQGSAAFAAAVAYFGHLAGMSFMITILKDTSAYNAIFNTAGVSAEDMRLITSLFGFDNVMDMSILGAIFNGIIVWKLHEALCEKRLPTFISFFGGKRFTPTLCVILFPTIGIVYTFTWVWLAKGLYFVGKGFTYLGIAGPGLMIFTSRLLCPTGLHHMFNGLFNYTSVGGVHNIYNTSGEVIDTATGNLNAMNMYMKHNMGVPADVSMWLTGAYILPLLFGLPAAALAMYFACTKDNRPMVKAAIISGIVATIGGGITETIEFLFLFVAPLLYLFHALMIGIGYVIFAAFHAQIGMGGDIFVFTIYGPIQGLYTKWWLAFILGPVDAALYYSVFYFSIKLKDIQTLGRQKEGTENKALNAVLGVDSMSDLVSDKKGKKPKKIKNQAEITIAEGFLILVGGWKNIETLTNCFTRLRVTLKEPRVITDQDVKSIGAVGLKTISEISYQFVCGPQVEMVRSIVESKRYDN